MKNSWLDFKLGARMLLKYPGLTFVGGLGMAVAIAVSTGFFVFFYSFMFPAALPLNEGDRIVGIMSWDAAANRQETRQLHDFVTWRDELTTFEAVGAYVPIQRNLIVPGGLSETHAGAKITADGLRLARVPPVLGRLLIADDEREGAADVVVIGYDVWQTQFSSDPSVVGRAVRLGGAIHTVVGVMPDGFGFPVSQQLWVPMRANPLDYARRQGPEIEVFGRLAPGATWDSAQAELNAIAQRTALAFPQTHQQLRLRVVPYTAIFFNEADLWQVHLIQLLVTLLLVIVSVNVASLVYARTATRHSEIAVRTALGASRRRIVGQLFVEALVLTMAAAVAGLLITDVALRSVGAQVQQFVSLPFWVTLGVSWRMVLYVAALAMLGAAIVGIMPALQATGHRLQSGLRELGGGTAMRLGRTWTALIVAQVAFVVALMPMAAYQGWQLMRYGLADPGFAADQFLSARVAMDETTPPSAQAEKYRLEFAARYGTRIGELVERLKAERLVSAVTFSGRVPGAEGTSWIEVDGITPPKPVNSDFAVRTGSGAGHEVRAGLVDVDFFTALDVPLAAGRLFQPGDRDPAAIAVIVNGTFVQQVLGSTSPLGQRLRYVGISGDAPPGIELGRWYEIVGVVGNVPVNRIEPLGVEARLYHASTAANVYPALLAIHVSGRSPAEFSERLRAIATDLDPSLRLEDVLALDAAYGQEQRGMRTAALAIMLVMVSVLLLSSAGLYTLMSFTVIQRQREIGIRVALGANANRILVSIFSRALRQLATGIALGLIVAGGLDFVAEGDTLYGQSAILLPGVAFLMIVVGLFAALGPARRGLKIQPTEALKSEG